LILLALASDGQHQERVVYKRRPRRWEGLVICGQERGNGPCGRPPQFFKFPVCFANALYRPTCEITAFSCMVNWLFKRKNLGPTVDILFALSCILWRGDQRASHFEITYTITLPAYIEQCPMQDADARKER